MFGSAKYHTLISPPTRWDFGLEGNRGLATAGAFVFLPTGLALLFGAYIDNHFVDIN
jgi:hypothetical protein